MDFLDDDAFRRAVEKLVAFLRGPQPAGRVITPLDWLEDEEKIVDADSMTPVGEI